MTPEPTGIGPSDPPKVTPGPVPIEDTGGDPDPIDPPPPPADQANCPNLALVAIGDATDAPPEAAAASARFRAMASTELTRPDLVCARPLVRWRDDLVIQPLVVLGRPDGILAGGLGDQGPVVRLTVIEWQSFKQFHGDDANPHNYLGVPTERTEISGVAMVRTTRGALVMARPDTFGIGVVNGSWDVWMAHSGPTGDMGLPTANPAGTSMDGAHQDFAGGYVIVPTGRTPLEAEAQPASAYRWQPISQADRRADLPADHSVVEIEGTKASYYVDDDGIRHWISSTADYFCATNQLHAPPRKVRGYVAGEVPLGPMFRCP